VRSTLNVNGQFVSSMLAAQSLRILFWTMKSLTSITKRSCTAWLNGIIMQKIMLQGGSDALKVKIDKIDEVAKKVADHHRIYNSDVKALQDRVAKLEKK
jgi:hypothetical protein